MKIRARTLLLMAGASLAGSCADEPTFPTLCDGTVQVQAIRQGDEVRFTWSPECGVSVITVSEGDPYGGNVMWGVAIPESAPAGPDVVYGELPRGGEAWAGPVPFSSGKSYWVRVTSTEGGDVVVGGGITSFVW